MVKDAYRAGYENGKRLTGLDDCLDHNLAAMDQDYRLDNAVQSRLNAYVIGFSDGWHGIEPELS